MTQQRYLDSNGREIEVGYLLTAPTNLKPDGKPVQLKGILICAGRHDEENIVFVRSVGSDMIHQFHPSRLEIITGKDRAYRVRLPSLAQPPIPLG